MVPIDSFNWPSGPHIAFLISENMGNHSKISALNIIYTFWRSFIIGGPFMVLYESIQRLIEITSFSPDTILLIFANAVLLYELLWVVVYALGFWLMLRFLDWLLGHFKRRKKL